MKARLAVYIILAILVLLLTARLYHGPVALVIVAGRSMEPTLRFGDIALAVKGGYKVGDIVVWCRGPLSCIIHRLLSVRDGVVVTKGDANPIPDPPVPAKYVEYRVVAVIPRELVWGPLAAYIVYELYRAHRRVVAELAAEVSALIVVSVYVIVVLATPVVAPKPASNIPDIASILPRIELKGVKLYPNRTLIVEYIYHNASLGYVTSCTASIGGFSEPCYAELRGETLLVTIPRHVLDKAYALGATMLFVNITASVKPMGVLEASYPINIVWRRPVIRVEDCSIKIVNPNPATLEANITIVGVTAIFKKSIRVDAGSTYTYKLPRTSAWVAVDYVEPGGAVKRWSKRIKCGR